MPLKAEFRPRFKKDFKALALPDQAEINEAINHFLRKTGKFDVVRFSAELWRFKIGLWRVFFTFAGDLLVFLTVARRSSITY